MIEYFQCLIVQRYVLRLALYSVRPCLHIRTHCCFLRTTDLVEVYNKQIDGWAQHTTPPLLVGMVPGMIWCACRL